MGKISYQLNEVDLFKFLKENAPGFEPNVSGLTLETPPIKYIDEKKHWLYSISKATKDTFIIVIMTGYSPDDLRRERELEKELKYIAGVDEESVIKELWAAAQSDEDQERILREYGQQMYSKAVAATWKKLRVVNAVCPKCEKRFKITLEPATFTVVHEQLVKEMKGKTKKKK